jgi:CRP-like cAMP-binding protein
LEDEVLGTGSKGYQTTYNRDKIPERKPRKTHEWRQFEESLATDPSVNDVSLLEKAIPAAASLLGLPPEKSSILKEGASIALFPPGSIICRPGDALNSIYLILRGSLEVGYGKNGKGRTPTPIEKQSISRRKESAKNRSRQADEGADGKSLFRAGPGTFVGLFSSFTSDSSFIAVHNPTSENNALLLQISPRTLELIVSTYPRVLIHCLVDILDTIGSSPSVYLLGK